MQNAFLKAFLVLSNTEFMHEAWSMAQNGVIFKKKKQEGQQKSFQIHGMYCYHTHQCHITQFNWHKRGFDITWFCEKCSVCCVSKSSHFVHTDITPICRRTKYSSFFKALHNIIWCLLRLVKLGHC